jgi:hypothetical protein
MPSSSQITEKLFGEGDVHIAEAVLGEQADFSSPKRKVEALNERAHELNLSTSNSPPEFSTTMASQN